MPGLLPLLSVKLPERDLLVPVTSWTDPLVPLAVVPVLSNIRPDVPAEMAFADRMTTFPEEDTLPPPDEIATEPPNFRVDCVEPAWMTTAGPGWITDVPATREIAPA